MRRVGVDLEAIARGTPYDPEIAADCPGASLRVTRADLAEMTRDGERFLDGPPLPADGYGEARVYCRRSVQRLQNPVSKRPTYAGLCESCGALAARNRASLRSRVQRGGS